MERQYDKNDKESIKEKNTLHTSIASARKVINSTWCLLKRTPTLSLIFHSIKLLLEYSLLSSVPNAVVVVDYLFWHLALHNNRIDKISYCRSRPYKRYVINQINDRQTSHEKKLTLQKLTKVNELKKYIEIKKCNTLIVTWR